MALPVHHVIAAGPRPVAPFSHAVEADGFIFITGQMPTDPAAPDAPLSEGIEAQTRRVIANLEIVLGGLGLGLEHVLMARIYLTQFERDYAALNALWPAFWAEGRLPARTTVGVTALAVGALIEIDLVAKRP
jgi:2-iminobutanoate/2-iminopropanoate deaminase